MTKIYIIIFALFFSISCHSQNDISEKSNLVLIESESEQTENEYLELKREVDNIYNNEISKVELYIQADAESKIERVPNFDNIPESILKSYNIVRGSDNNIIMIAEYPYSESGDWDNSYESYFDKSGNLVAFVRLSNFFNGICAEIVKERSIYYYNKDQKLVKKTYEIKDGDENPLIPENCEFYYRFDYIIYKTLTEYLDNNKFE